MIYAHCIPVAFRTVQIMDFILEQPETKKMLFKGTDYFPKKRLTKKQRRAQREALRRAKQEL